jgi:hypothetical protein
LLDLPSQVVTEAETYYFPVVIVKEAAKKMYLGAAATRHVV